MSILVKLIKSQCSFNEVPARSFVDIDELILKCAGRSKRPFMWEEKDRQDSIEGGLATA